MNLIIFFFIVAKCARRGEETKAKSMFEKQNEFSPVDVSSCTYLFRGDGIIGMVLSFA